MLVPLPLPLHHLVEQQEGKGPWALILRLVPQLQLLDLWIQRRKKGLLLVENLAEPLFPTSQDLVGQSRTRPKSVERVDASEQK